MTIAFAIVTIALATLYVAWPFFAPTAHTPGGAAPEIFDRDALLQEKETLYATIKDLEFEYHTGKLSDTDYRELRTRYRTQALNLLEALDDLQATAPNRAMGQAKTPCPACGHRTPPMSNFCEWCGTPMARPETCPNCGVAADPLDRFCAGCGRARWGSPGPGAVRTDSDAHHDAAVELTP